MSLLFRHEDKCPIYTFVFKIFGSCEQHLSGQNWATPNNFVDNYNKGRVDHLEEIIALQVNFKIEPKEGRTILL